MRVGVNTNTFPFGLWNRGFFDASCRSCDGWLIRLGGQAGRERDEELDGCFSAAS